MIIFQMCINQTCINQFPYVDLGKCPSNDNNHECSGHGVSIHLFLKMRHYLYQFVNNRIIKKC